MKFGKKNKQKIVHLLRLDFEIFKLFFKKSKHWVEIPGVNLSVSCFEELVLLLKVVVNFPPLNWRFWGWKTGISQCLDCINDVFTRKILHSLFQIQFMQKIVTESFLSWHFELFEHDQCNERIHTSADYQRHYYDSPLQSVVHIVLTISDCR